MKNPTFRDRGPDRRAIFSADDFGLSLAVNEGIDTTTPEGSAQMAAIALLKGYQQALRHQKARAGQLRAVAAGVPFGRPPVPDNIIRSVRTALAAGHGIRPTARKMGISPARVATEKAAMTADRAKLL